MRRGYARLYERVRAAGGGVDEQLRALEAAAVTAHPDDVAAVRAVLLAEHRYGRPMSA